MSKTQQSQSVIKTKIDKQTSYKKPKNDEQLDRTRHAYEIDKTNTSSRPCIKRYQMKPTIVYQLTYEHTPNQCRIIHTPIGLSHESKLPRV